MPFHLGVSTGWPRRSRRFSLIRCVLGGLGPDRHGLPGTTVPRRAAATPHPNRVKSGQRQWDAPVTDVASHREPCSVSLGAAARTDPNRVWGRKAAASWPFTLLPAASSLGANVPSPPLPGDTVTIPPPMPLLPGNPMVYSHSPEVSYRPAVVMGKSAPATRLINDSLTRQRIHSASRDGCGHHGKVSSRDTQAALPRVEINGLLESVACLPKLRSRSPMARSIEFVVEAEAKTSSSILSSRPAKRDSPC